MEKKITSFVCKSSKYYYLSHCGSKHCAGKPEMEYLHILN